MDRLPKTVRQERILQRLSNDVAVRISTLADEFGVTTETIRRDLDELSARGLLARTYGGAAVRSVAGEPGVQTRAQENIAGRQRIAAAAVEEVRPGDVLMIDAGSTTAHFARALVRQPIELTVITNSLTVARALAAAESVAVMLCPGDLRLTEEAVFGVETVGFLERYHADVAVIGAGGITPEEITDADALGAAVKRKMIARASRTVLIADHGKFGQTQFATVCASKAIDLVITDEVPAQVYYDVLHGVRVASFGSRDAAA
jgi:DeoR/GlpR family transcriptional regulator of sugar metabolism